MAQVLQRQPARGFDTGTRMVAKTDEQRVLWPQYVGNQDRPVVHRQYYDVIEDVAVILEETFRIRTWVLSASPLLYGWPKVRLRDGVKVLKGVREYYNAHPMTEVPMEGTVRTMSMQLIEYNLTMSQKGIGARMHGAVLERPEGAATLNKHMDAFAESAMMTMALQTAMKMVSTAWRQGMMVAGTESSGMAQSRRIYNQLQMYAVIGLDTREVIRIVDEIFSNNPEFNLLYIPDRTDVYFNTDIVPQAVAVPQFTYDGKNYQPIETQQTLQPLASLKGGAVTVLPMTKFSVYSANHEYQPLETTISIGEVYVDDQNMRLAPNRGIHYSGSMEDIYVYDHTIDHWSKLEFEVGVRNSFIWNRTTKTSADYSAHLKKFVEDLNKRGKPEELRDAHLPITYPVVEKRDGHIIQPQNEKHFFLPAHIGNLNEEHLSSDTLDDMINSYVNGVRNDASFVDVFGTQGSDMEALESIRTEIEGAEYDAASLENMARLNISKRGNVIVDGNGGAAFVGKQTPRNRLPKGSRMRGVHEWAPNAYGSLDIDAKTKPVGMFNAAGIATIAKTQGHSLQPYAERAHRFITRLASHHFDIFALTGNITANAHNMSPHLHNDSRAQVVLDTMYGRRLPAFLAAPLSLVQPQKAAANLPSSVTIPDIKSSNVILTTGNPDDGIIVESDNFKWFWTPDGVLFLLPAGVDTTRFNPMQNLLGLDTIIIRILQTTETESVVTRAVQHGMLPSHASNLKMQITRDFVRAAIPAKKQEDVVLYVRLYLLLMQKLGNGEETEVETYLVYFGRPSLRKSQREELRKILPDGSLNEPGEAVLLIIKEAQQGDYASSLSKRDQDVAEAYQIFADATKKAIQSYLETSKKLPPAGGYYLSGDHPRLKIEGGVNLLKDDNIDSKAKDQLKKANQILSARLGVDYKLSAKVKVVKRTTDATIQDLQKARYYRAPLNFTMNLLEAVKQKNVVPWILPADPDRALEAPIDLNDNDVVSALMEHPYLVNSQTVIGPDHTMPPDATQSSAETLRRLDTVFHDLVVAYGTDRAIEIMRSGAGLGNIHWRLWYVRREYFSSPLKRLAGVALLLTPHDRIDAIQHLHRHNIMLPFEIWYWRLWSTYKMGEFLAMKAGLSAGINMFGHERMMVARDNTRDSVRIRATMDMESHPVDPSLHALSGPLQPRGYIGGHDARVVEDPAQLKTDMRELRDMPSVIATVNIRGQGATREFPLSFVNKVPARFDSSHAPRMANPSTQHWSGSPFYQMVYNGYFNPRYLEKYQGSQRSSDPMSYFKSPQRRQHLAWRGYHARYQPKTNTYQREVPGVGHRANPMLNSPGSKAYMNGNPFLKTTSMLSTHVLG